MDMPTDCTPPAIPPKSRKRRNSKAANDEAYARYRASKYFFDLDEGNPDVLPEVAPLRIDSPSPSQAAEPTAAEPISPRQASISTSISSATDKTDFADDDSCPSSPVSPTSSKTSFASRFRPTLHKPFTGIHARPSFRKRSAVSLRGKVRPVISAPITTAPVIKSDFSERIERKDWSGSNRDYSADLTEKEAEALKARGVSPALYAEMRSATGSRRSRWLSPITGFSIIPTF